MHPVVLLGVSVELQELFHFLIGLFRLAISSWVESSGSVLSYARCLARFGCEFACESGILVMDECLGESYMFEYVFQVEFGNSFCSY